MLKFSSNEEYECEREKTILLAELFEQLPGNHKVPFLELLKESKWIGSENPPTKTDSSSEDSNNEPKQFAIANDVHKKINEANLAGIAVVAEDNGESINAPAIVMVGHSSAICGMIAYIIKDLAKNNSRMPLSTLLSIISAMAYSKEFQK